jgi:hypothetical protein
MAFCRPGMPYVKHICFRPGRDVTFAKPWL